MQIKANSFTLNANSEKEALEILLSLNNLTVDTFTKKMGESPLLGDIPHQWAITYLKDILDANLIHLGYIFKDTKTDGIIKPISRLEEEIAELKLSNSIEAQIPFIFNKDIVTEQGEIKVAYIANIERLLEDFKVALEEQ